MCEPVTALTVAATAVAAAGSGVSAIQSASMQRYQARVADRNAGLSNEAARDAQDRNRIEAQRLYRKTGAVAGQQNAAMAANGIDLGFGSALQVQQDTAAIGAEDVSQLYRSGYQETRGFEISASNDRAQAAGARAGAKAAIVKGVFDVGSTVLGGASQVSKYKRGMR